MKKELTEEEFQKAVLALEIGQQSKDIAYGVLVLGHQQKRYIETLNISKGAVSQAVKRVWDCHQNNTLPMGFARVTAVVTEQQAYQVKVWEQTDKKKIGK